jgi:hypothetical protein
VSSEGYKATLEWGFWKYIKYLLFTILITGIIVWVLVRFGNIDLHVWAYHMANPALFVPEIIIVLGSAYVWHWSRNSESKKKQKRYRKHLDTILREAKGGDKD